MNSVIKDHSRVRLKFALAFPDLYEVGMSHLGIQILYHILNQRPDIACERVFAPWPDMEKFLRERNLPLCSLESSWPLDKFDILGFSLQYELNYTGVLTILNLAGIPRKAAERGEEYPLIIGGGPCALNPEPLADFFDLFVLGDGEEVILEICQTIMAAREKGKKKEKLLESLAHLEGVYIPSFFRIEYEAEGRVKEIVPLKKGPPAITRRVLADLNQGVFPTQPVLPFMEVIHDRLNIEIARGCTRGCRFCQAGMIYRPLRERSPYRILELVKSGLESTGYDEVSLLSLSSGDYSFIEPLLHSILEHTYEERIGLSLPSLRVETLTPGLIQKVQEVRKTGFTLAPEAGTERLRRVINKGNTEEDLLSSIHRVFSANWRLVKLYFMIGLPTEGEEDLKGIASLCQKALRIARRLKASAQMNVSISTFIPKTHTPFQWEPQCSMEEAKRKQQFLRKSMDRHGLSFKWADVRLSFLEGVFARGDRRLGKVLEIAHSLGCRLDGWGEHLRFDLWEKAFLQAGLDPSFYLRQRDLDEILPWDHLESRVAKSFQKEERNKAFQASQTPDCRQGSCNGCGVCYGVDTLSNRLANREEIQIHGSFPKPNSKNASFLIRRFRCRLAKIGPAKFLGHLEFCQLMIRAFRRAKTPLVFSQGFHPLPRVAFGPPLPVGHESWAEYLDLHVQGNFHLEEGLGRLRKVLPPGVAILEIQEIPLKSPSIFDNISAILYKILLPNDSMFPEERIAHFAKADSFLVFWSKKKKNIELKYFIASIFQVEGDGLRLLMHRGPEGFLRPEEALQFIFGWSEGEGPPLTIQKIQVQFKDLDPWLAKS